MNNASLASISSTTIHQALQTLLNDYQKELAESQQDNDTYYTGYWDSACRTIYEIAGTLNIPLEDPWVDPSWVRTAEYENLMRKRKRQRRKHQKEQSS